MFNIPDIFVVWHAVYVVVTVPTIFGNLLIIISVLKYRKLQSTMNILVANLAIADLIVGALLIPFDVVGDATGFNNEKYYCLGKYAMFVLSLGSSGYNLLLISVERFVAVVFPLQKGNYFTKPRLIIMIAIGWWLNITDSLVPLCGWNNYDGNITECIPDDVWTKEYSMFNGWLVVIAYILNVTFYAIVMSIAVKKARSTSVVGNIQVHVSRRRDLAHLKTMVVILGLFAVCWFPYICMNIVVTFYHSSHMLFIRRCSLIPGIFNSSLNWLVYGYRNQDFRKAFWALLLCGRYRRRNDSDDDNGV